LACGQPGEAVPEFQAAQLIRPEAWEGLHGEGCARGGMGDYPGAERSLTAALGNGGPPALTCLRRAFARIRSGSVDGALADLLTVHEHGGLDEESRVLLAWLRLRRREWAEAQALLASVRSERLTPAVTPMLAFALERQGRLDAAASLYRQAIGSRIPGDGVLFHHGLVSYRLTSYGDAARFWSALHRLHPSRALAALVVRANQAWARELIERRDFEMAITCLEPCAEWLASGALAELRLHAAAESLRQGGREGREQARRHLEAARARAPADARALHYLALLEGLDGRPANALTLSERALDLGPDGAGTRYALALCAIQAHDATRAETELTRLTDAGEDRGARALAALHILHGRWPGAADLLFGLPDGDPLRQAILPECLYRCARLEDLERLPRSSQDAVYWRAVAYAQQGHADAALAAIRALPGHAGTGRARRELAMWLRMAALTEAQAARWPRAASLLAECHGQADAPTAGPLFEGVVLALGGHRSEAIIGLLEASSQDPRNSRLTHGLALMLLHTLRSEAGRRELDDQPELWRRCVGIWVALLHDDSFWESRRRESEARYGVTVPPSFMDSLKARVGGLLREALSDGAQADGQRAQELPTLLQRELEAARALAGVGGFPRQAAAGPALVCGPLRIAELGMEREFGAFAVNLFPDGPLLADLLELLADATGEELDVRDDEPERGRRDVFFRCFSQLGAAHVQLMAGRAAEALDALSDLRCPHCGPVVRQPPAPNRRASAPPEVCPDTCLWFDAYNPAYAALAGKHRRLRDDAVKLSVDAYLELARAAATGPGGAAAAAAAWRDAVGRAQAIGQQRWAERRVAETALRCAAALQSRGSTDDAIGLLEAACRVCTERRRAQLVGRLAEALTDRAIAAANAAIDTGKTEPGRIAGVADDLRWAVELNPYSTRAVVNLATALRILATECMQQGRPDQSVGLLEEAVRTLRGALRRIPGQREIEKALAAVEGELVMAKLVAVLVGGRGGK
jgi:tetratricopeptide (TPR) repeat protein